MGEKDQSRIGICGLVFEPATPLVSVSTGVALIAQGLVFGGDSVGLLARGAGQVPGVVAGGLAKGRFAAGVLESHGSAPVGVLGVF